MGNRIRVFNNDVPLFFVVLLGMLFACGLFTLLFFGHEIGRTRYYAAVAEPVWGKIPDDLTFKSTSCETAGPYFDPFVENMQWVSDNNLRIQVSVPVNCADNNWLGNFQQEGENQLLLQYITLPNMFEAACICKADLEYLIDNIKMNDYSVEIQEIELE